LVKGALQLEKILMAPFGVKQLFVAPLSANHHEFDRNSSDTNRGTASLALALSLGTFVCHSTPVRNHWSN